MPVRVCCFFFFPSFPFFLPSEPENDRWRDLSRKCPLQLEQPGASIWDCLSDKGEEGSRWPRDAAATCSVTNLIKDLSLSDPHGHPSAPPSKRQCRSLSFSDEMSGCGTSWRPLGSKVWTPVEKRRCYSGGSVQRYSNGVATMQRSSSFSLPARSNPLCGGQPRKSAAGGHGGDRVDIQRSLSCSHERFSCSEYGAACTPELGRRAAGLARSRSQPCVLNDKKVGIKRRRPEEVQEQRPSLDLAKMTQVRAVGPSRQGAQVFCALFKRFQHPPGWVLWGNILLCRQNGPFPSKGISLANFSSTLVFARLVHCVVISFWHGF